MDYNIDFIEYNPDNIEHKSLIMNITNDEETKEYFYDFERFVNNVMDDETGKVYISTICDVATAVICLQIIDGKYIMSYALPPGKRGEGIGSFVVDVFTTRLLKRHKEIDRLYLHIRQDNKPSRIVAARAGYVEDSSVRYVRENPYIIKSNI